MSPALMLVAVVTMTWMLAQFGGRVAARSAISWWLIAGFLMVSAVVPAVLRPIADLLGIEFISNFVLATMLVFLLLQTMEQVADSTDQGRRLRTLTCRTAAAAFVDRRGSREPTDHPRVLVVLPCYNEQQVLPATVAAISAVSADDLDIDWCVVNDGSADRSRSILREQAPNNHTSHLANVGVAGVLLTGFYAARELDVDYVVQCDADGQHPFETIPELVRAAIAADADMLIGSRYATSDRKLVDDSSTPLRRLGGSIIAVALQLFGRVPVTDPTSGFRAYSPKAMDFLIRNMPDEYPEPESVALLALAGNRILEHPVAMRPRAGGESSIASFGAVRFMVKVLTAILGLRLRSLARKPR